MTTINKKRVKYHLFYQNHHHQKNFLSYHQLIIFPVFLLLRLRETQNALQFFLFAILFFYFFFIFLFLALSLDRLAKDFYLSFPKTRVTGIGPASLDTLANVSSLFFSQLFQYGKYLFNIYEELIENCLACLTRVCLKLQFTA